MVTLWVILVKRAKKNGCMAQNINTVWGPNFPQGLLDYPINRREGGFWKTHPRGGGGVNTPTRSHRCSMNLWSGAIFAESICFNLIHEVCRKIWHHLCWLCFGFPGHLLVTDINLSYERCSGFVVTFLHKFFSKKPAERNPFIFMGSCQILLLLARPPGFFLPNPGGCLML